VTLVSGGPGFEFLHVRSDSISQVCQQISRNYGTLRKEKGNLSWDCAPRLSGGGDK
jgi:hypothetical protein